MLFTVTGIAVPPSKYCREYLTSSAASPFAASTSFNVSEAPLSRRSMFGLVREPVVLQSDPHQHVNSEAWQALDESERIESVRQYHRQNRIRLASESLHATTHVIVENQVALGDTFAARAVLLRLMAEGLDRHEAIHAIGSVLSEHLFAALTEDVGSHTNAPHITKS